VSWDHPALSKDDAYDVAGFVISHLRQPREGAKDFSNPSTSLKIFLGAVWYVDSFSETQHQYGPFEPIRAEDAAAHDKEKQGKGGLVSAN
jgi:thiosulfate dehydrogenase